MSNYFNRHGLINAKLIEDVSENCSLFTLEYLLLKGKYYKGYGNILRNLLIYIEKCRTDIPGLYNQLPEKANNKDDYMSPDQLIAFAGSLHLASKNREINLIWNYLKEHKFTYDNLSKTTNFERLMQPMAVSFVAVLNNKKHYYPLLIATIIHSCITKKGKSSGKLKAWVCLSTLKLHFLKNVCENILSGFNNWNEVFNEYFQEDDHPNRQE